MSDAAADWPDQIYALFKEHGIRQVALVPDAGHSRLIKRCLADNDIKVTTLTTEEEGIGLIFGAWLGGEKGVLLMQSSGVGNCINMLSVPIAHRTPCPMIVTMRGDYGEFNPFQIPMGNATQTVLEAMGKNIIHAGGAGNGQAAKICNNMMLGIQMISVAEAFNLAASLGLEAQTLFDISSRASGQCWSLTTYCPVPGPVPTSPANRDYQPGFTTAMMLKDLKLAQEASAKSGAHSG